MSDEENKPETTPTPPDEAKATALHEGMMNANDRLHPTVRGYQVWADGLKPLLTELLGPPASTDLAPPPPIPARRRSRSRTASARC